MKLNGPQRERFHKALMDAFRTRAALERMVNFGLETSLETITSAEDLPTAVYKLIDWAESYGRLPDLVKAACEHNPKNPELEAFVQQIWKPLDAQEKPLLPISEQSDGQPVKPDTHTLTSSENGQVIGIDLRRESSRRTNIRKRRASDTNKTTDAPPPPLPFPADHSSKREHRASGEFLQLAHNQTEIAREAIQTILVMLQPEKDVFRDQCQVARLKLQEASASIEEISTKLADVPSPHAPSLYRLTGELTYFGKEAEEAFVSLQQFSGQTTSIPLRKSIWDKLQKLIKSLQEVDYFLEDFSKHVEEH